MTHFIPAFASLLLVTSLSSVIVVDARAQAGATVAPEQQVASDTQDASPMLRRERGWLDVNIGLAVSGDDANSFVYTGTLYREPFAVAAHYPAPPSGASVDIGGGVMLSSLVGVGVSVSGTAYEEIVGLGATIPHPYFFNREVVASGATDEPLMRSEGSIHLQAMLAPYQSRRVRVRAFGGPTYFRYEADLVQDVRYQQFASLFNPNQTVNIVGYDAVTTEGTGWGWHAGTDISVFFTRVVGLGGFLRYSRGSVTIDEPLSERPQDVTVGGLQVGGGLRLRF